MGKKRCKFGRNARTHKGRAIRTALWTYAEAAMFLGIAEKTLRKWKEDGVHGLPYVRLGSLIRFRPDSLERWLESRERGGTQLAPSVTQELEAR